MKKKILLVEDEIPVALDVAQNLEKHGYTVVTAHKGEKAIEQVKTDPDISLVLMDIGLGTGMDGTEAAEEILSLHELPIVFLTSHSEKEYVDRVRKITNYGYVLKNSGEFVLIESIQMAYTLFESKRELKKENSVRRETEEEFSFIYRHTPVLMLVIDKERRVRKANAFAAQFAGTPAEEILGSKMGEALRCLHHLDDPQGCGFGPFCKECTVRSTVEHTFATGKEYFKAEATLPFLQDGKKQQLTFLVSTSLLHKEEEDLCLVAFEDITDYKELQEKYKGLFENAPLPYQSLDENGNFIDVNLAWLEALGGYTREEVIGKNFADSLHPDSLDEFRDNFEKLKKYGTCGDIIYKMEKKSGDYIDVSYNGVVAYTPDGDVKQTHCIFKDITERKQSEEAIQESNLRLTTVIDSIDALVYITDMETYEIIFINEYGRRIFGDITGQKCWKALQGQDEPCSFCANDKLVDKDGNPTGVFAWEHQNTLNGRWYDCRDSAVQWFDGRMVRIEVATDVTKRKEAIRKNIERKQYLEAILNTTPSALVTLNRDNRISEWNKGAEVLFGYIKEEVLGKNLDELIAGKDEEIYKNASTLTNKTQTGETIPPTEGIRYTKEGTPKNVIITASPILVDNTFQGSVGTYTDISPLKQKETEVQTLLQEKEQLLREVHHRIKNHMSTIAAIISLRKSRVADSQISEILDELHNKIRLMQNIYHTLYTGEEVGTIHINSFLQELLHDIKSTYFNKQSLQIKTDIEDIEVTSKQSLTIGIIVTELISNAIKYAFEGREEGTISISINKLDEDRLSIQVADNGTGLSDEIIEAKSYGFGLMLVDGYVRQFDGQMSIDNSHGTSIAVTLKLEE